MKKVSVRAFQLKPYDYLKELPIMLTRYGEDIAVIHKASQIIGIATPRSSGNPDIKKLLEDTTVMKVITEEPPEEVKEKVKEKKDKLNEEIGFSDKKKSGYHYSSVVNGYVKD